MSTLADAGNQVSAASPQRRMARFGVFELDARSGELRRDGARVPLQEQPGRILLFLIERGGEVVTREELREMLWPTDFVDFDHSLNTAIRKLRAALDDSADNPRFVETLARRGYRFLAPVSWVSPDTTAVERPRTRSRAAIVAVIAAAVTILIASIAIMSRRSAPAAPTIWAVAVLPFTHDQQQTEHLSDGLTEVVIDSLSRLPEMRVMARTTVFRYKGRTLDPQRVGRELDVGAVVVGDVRRQRDGYAIRVELIDVRDGTQLWGERFQTTQPDLPLLQSRISDQLANRLRHGRRGSANYTRHAEAYELYLKGLHAWNERGLDDLRKSVDYFSRAAELDPSFAAAYAGLANTWGVMVGRGTVPPDEGAAKVIAAARKSLELDPENASAYTSLATTKFRNLWDFAGAEHDYRRALTLNPNYATAHQWYADYLRAMGRFEEARRHTDTAYKLDPLSTAITASRCWSFLYERRYRDAIAFSRNVGQVDRRFRTLFCEAQAQFALGDFEQALAALAQMEPSRNEMATALEAAYRRGGPEGMNRRLLELLTATENAEYQFPVEIAEAHAILGNRDEAFAWLEIAYRHRVSRLTSFHLQPAFDRLRHDPRFDDLLRRIGLPKFDVPRSSS